MYHMGWVKNEGMQSEESGICDESFEGSLFVHPISKCSNWNPESEMSFWICAIYCVFLVRVRVRVRVCLEYGRSSDKVRLRDRVRVC